MDSVIRPAVMYLSLMLIFRVAGRRTLSEMTDFDFVLLLIISEATQQALIGNDASITGSLLVILTLVGLNIAFSLGKRQSPRVQRWLEGLPTLIVENGQPLREVMRWARVDESDILVAARRSQGLERMEQIKYAILERSGGISIVPQSDARGGTA